MATSPKYLCLLIYFTLLVLITVHIVMEAGLSYTDTKGCYRRYARDENSGEFERRY